MPTASEKELFDLCRRSFLSYWSFLSPYRPGADSKEFCDALVICDRHILVFSDKSISYPTTHGDDVNWKRWFKRSITGSVRQLHGAHRLLQVPQPQIYNAETRAPIRVALPQLSERDIHLIAVANGATEACSIKLGEPIGTLMLSNDKDHGSDEFSVGDVGHNGAFVHVFTDLSLRMVLHEFDTVTDLVRYLGDRANFFRSSLRVHVRGEEELIALYLKGYDDQAHTYSILRGLDLKDNQVNSVWVDTDLYTTLRNRPEYKARHHANQVSYLWDSLIEQFARHQIAGTSTRIAPANYEWHEGGIRLMALESRLARRALSAGLHEAVNSFPKDKTVSARTLFSTGPHGSLAYVFLQAHPFEGQTHDDYRVYRSELLRVMSLSLLHDLPTLSEVVGVACEPVLLFQGKPSSEDILLARRDIIPGQQLSDARRKKTLLGFSDTLPPFESVHVRDFPES